MIEKVDIDKFILRIQKGCNNTESSQKFVSKFSAILSCYSWNTPQILAIASSEYSKIYRKNNPQPFKIISSANFENEQTACEMWNLIRLLPLILGPHITEGNIYWDLYINFRKFVERLCSLTFYSTEMIILSEHIERLFTKYVDIF